MIRWLVGRGWWGCWGPPERAEEGEGLSAGGSNSSTAHGRASVSICKSCSTVGTLRYRCAVGQGWLQPGDGPHCTAAHPAPCAAINNCPCPYPAWACQYLITFAPNLPACGWLWLTAAAVAGAAGRLRPAARRRRHPSAATADWPELYQLSGPRQRPAPPGPTPQARRRCKLASQKQGEYLRHALEHKQANVLRLVT